jgi:hypothetical protein
MPAGDHARCELALSWNGGGPIAGRLLYPTDLLELAPGAGRALEAGAGAHDAVVALCFSDALRARLTESFGAAALEVVGDVADFLKVWRRDGSQGGVVEVRPGDEGVIGLLGGMRNLPGCAERPLLVVLDQPTVANVIACGRAALYDVLPGDCDAAILRARWPQASAAAK